MLNGNDASLRSWAIANKEDTRFATWFVSSLKYKDEILAEGFPIFWYEDLTLTADSTDFRVKCSFTPEESWPIHLPFAASHLTESTMFGLACAYVQGLNESCSTGCKRLCEYRCQTANKHVGAEYLTLR